MGASEVQHRSVFTANVTSTTLAFSSNVTAGNLLAYLTSDFPQASVAAATDNNSNTIANAVSFQTSDGDNRMDYVASANSGATTVTGNAPSGGATLFLHIRELTGCATVSPVRDTGTAHSSTASVSTAGSTSQSGDAVIAFFSDSPSADAMTVGSGYTDFEFTQDNISNNESASSEYKTATSSGTQTATIGIGGSNTLVQTIVVFKQAAGGGLVFEDDSYNFGTIPLLDPNVSLWR